MGLIRKPSQLEITQNIKVLLYGQPGIGKSTLALSSPSPLHLDFDKGVHRIKPIHQVDTVQITSWDDMIDLLEKEDITSYKTLAIDTAGKMLDFMSTYLIKTDSKLGKRDGSLTLQGYGARKVMFSNFLRQVDMLDKHLVFVAHEKEDKDGDVKIIRPEIGGSSGGDLVKELDLVGYMQAIGNKRTISFDPTEKFYGKNTCNLPAKLEIQDVSAKPNILLSNIFSTYHDSLDKRKEMVITYNGLIEKFQLRISEINDADEANMFVEWMFGMDASEHVWDSKLQAGRLFNKRVKELGLKKLEDGTYEVKVKASGTADKGNTSTSEQPDK